MLALGLNSLFDRSYSKQYILLSKKMMFKLLILVPETFQHRYCNKDYSSNDLTHCGSLDQGSLKNLFSQFGLHLLFFEFQTTFGSVKTVGRLVNFLVKQQRGIFDFSWQLSLRYCIYPLIFVGQVRVLLRRSSKNHCL